MVIINFSDFVTRSKVTRINQTHLTMTPPCLSLIPQNVLDKCMCVKQGKVNIFILICSENNKT